VEHLAMIVLIILAAFTLLTCGYIWVDSVPKKRKKHKRINNVRRLK
jgi:hypothetical protein